MDSQHMKEPSPANQGRKLRFITNQGAPNPKRRRVNAACLTCRKRKIACSGEHPICNTCTQNKTECGGYTKSNDREDLKPSRKNTYSMSSSPEQDRRRASLNHPSGRAGFSAGSDDITARTDPDMTNTPKPALFSGTRNRMPYFRWLGPTAIMPGFKQMVVKVNRYGPGTTSSTDEGGTMSSPDVSGLVFSGQRNSSAYSATPLPIESDVRTPLTLPFYDNSPMPPSELITHLCETFFTHLGCNFPFLQKERFLKDLESKQVDAILVDAVCSLAARFSSHSLLVEQADEHGKSAPSEYGQKFAQRAKIALVDTYAVPSVAAVQAALLLAYNEFGESRDSGLWMYLGISIRMAQDLGLQKLEGLRFEGQEGPTPTMVKRSQENKPRNPPKRKPSQLSESEDEIEVRAAERERIDTFWAIFFLDRVVSSGTGRRSTLRDNDIELSFPPLENSDSIDEWPSPFPALIRIVHLYGRVADLLNSIKEPSDVSPDTSKKLADMEARVTEFYSSLSPRLHFEAKNFQRHVKSGFGTNFVLLHFWFHTLIILLHQPTLLKTFEGRMLKLFPNSQQLSMSSAKTIVDILSYSQLIDAQASLGNPFTTQPIYIAASAFLRETAERNASSAEHSRAPSRPGSGTATPLVSQADKFEVHCAMDLSIDKKVDSADSKLGAHAMRGKTLAKHTLLVKRASQDYQLCHQALQAIETYWAGTKYILTVLDQKKKGVGDPLLYTEEEGERSLEQPIPGPTFSSPGWRRKLTWTPSSLVPLEVPKMPMQARDFAFETDKDLSQAIGWTFTGDLNSTNTNLSWHLPPCPASFPDTTVTTDTQGTRFAGNQMSPTSFDPYTVYNIAPDHNGAFTATNGDMTIESQDVDLSMLGFDILSWLDPSAGDMMGMFDGPVDLNGISDLNGGIELIEPS